MKKVSCSLDLLRALRLGEAIEHSRIEKEFSETAWLQKGAILAASSGNVGNCGNEYCYDDLETWRKTTYENRESIGDFVNGVSTGSISDFQLGFWLMSVAKKGMSQMATDWLTHTMAASGARFDYTKELGGFFVRRYPTGALSEKIALMMPIVLLFLRDAYQIDIKSPFLVARVMGHTGGTRDKLSCIPGFKMPEPGNDTIKILSEIGITYTATSGLFNPADDRMYSARSKTETIESEPLIVSSIASKMLACPVNLMQIDVRWGNGAFFKDREKALMTGRAICKSATTPKMNAFSTLTEANFPTGSMVGAAGEVAEAIAGLNPVAASGFCPNEIENQQLLLKSFSARLVSEASGLSFSDVYNKISLAIRTGSLLESFIKLFEAHSVKSNILSELWQNPRSCLSGYKSTEIRSNFTGRVRMLDQLKIGRLINSQFSNMTLEIKVGLSDYVEKGGLLAVLFSKIDTCNDENIESIQSAFYIE